MNLSLAYLGPTGTNTETVALAYANWLRQNRQQEAVLCSYPTIALSAKAVANQEVDLAVVPVENSIEGTVAITLDTLWQLEKLKITQSLVLPISHALLACSSSPEQIRTVYSHPQALGQCQQWLEQFLPKVKLIPTNSTTEALQYLAEESSSAAIASPRAAKLYNIPILAEHINDYPDNCTRFWVLSLNPTTMGNHCSLAFSLSENAPGALVKTLQIFARQGINLSKIESRPTKRSLGEYIFFIDLEGNSSSSSLQSVLAELSKSTEVLKIFGNYDLMTIKL